MLISHGLRAAVGGGGPTVISTVGTITSGSPSSLDLPSGIVAGDFLVMFISIATATGSPITTPTGWTQFLAQVTGPRSGAYYRVADGSEGATQSLTTSAFSNNTISSNILLIRGYTANDTIGSFSASDDTSPITNAGITPTASGLLLGFWGIRANGTTPVSVTGGPSGMTLANTVSGYTGNDAMTNAVYYQRWDATATGTREITTSGAIDTSRSLLLQIV